MGERNEIYIFMRNANISVKNVEVYRENMTISMVLKSKEYLNSNRFKDTDEPNTGLIYSPKISERQY